VTVVRDEGQGVDWLFPLADARLTDTTADGRAGECQWHAHLILGEVLDYRLIR
jgi:hypothetical protein